MEFELLNFDHTLIRPGKFNIGPFVIDISQQHCDNLKDIPRNTRQTYTHDEHFNRIVVHEDKVEGAWIPTAKAIINEDDLNQSLLGEPHLDAIKELCLLLTFLTGRRVTTPEYMSDHIPHRALYRTVIPHNIRFMGNCWNNLEALSKNNLSVPFINLTYAFEGMELLAISVYVLSSLNAAYDAWWSGNSKKYIPKKKLRNIASEYLTNSIANSFKYKMSQVFKDERLDNDLIDDFNIMFGKYLGELSAIYKFTKFLQAIELFPIDADKDTTGRLKIFNAVRNKMLHSGNIPKIKNVSDEHQIQVAISTIMISLLIMQYYFASNFLMIDDYELKTIKEKVLNYFTNGVFMGHKVFDETYMEYIERADEAWVNQGQYIR